MEHVRSDLERNQKIKNHEFANSIPVEIDRVFHAPIEEVWNAWTSEDLIKQWWGPEGYSCPEAHLDFREGGKYNFAMKGPDQKVSWSGGTVEEIIPFQKIVCTDHFTDKEGHPVPASEYGMAGDWPENLYMTVTFERSNQVANEIKMHLLYEGVPTSMHDDCVQGWNSSLDKMERLVERI
jgi:uncharacterized protein YndB with AHSA1/START domain